MKYLPVLLMAVFPCLSHAGTVSEDRDFIERMQSAEAQAQKMEVPDFIKQLKNNGVSRENMNFINSLQHKQQMQYQAAQNPQPAIQYFVSFSIPRNGLATMLNNAAQFAVPVNIRGMINNDFRQTANTIFEMTKGSNKGGVQINPRAFRQYGITAVPALVVTCGDKFDRVSGDIRIDGLLRKVAEGGDCADVAKAALKEAAQ
ncbi:type-F conjugative transfer system pilin assembly protein TrbC (plasmid) [Erwinia tracheiphila]|uniref:Type-F conjugative transfer system pilin assembly protein TrbC n=1 Tax=Erwinia tracheiphila TaxID=65700 RepID=A0A345D037_9GAMM|nr:type-F conjugative transfer system pilin assembly protein TrbC [Erwinia tracheiphila]AXF79054.1 type-F conjugative transfer system pilin assembly protein TrbC [Erwinia tracheiphila]UIA85936.1 type-F conjugative transfer system pilin assembly protein TrbC [Erwinia tracheiphila]UIA94460.1 type-F conjugative transfer system pilin assembly protein TrbC [Erwinia tracheiphila]